jgi:uncharacterized membrane protein YeaQ/YmgE (transglycosylase-associated protein family)
MSPNAKRNRGVWQALVKFDAACVATLRGNLKTAFPSCILIYRETKEHNMGILAWIILGGIAGWLAHLLTGRGGGIITNIVVGVVGALVGGFIMGATGGSGVTGFNLYSLAVAVLGAVILLVVLSAVRK